MSNHFPTFDYIHGLQPTVLWQLYTTSLYDIGGTLETVDSVVVHIAMFVYFTRDLIALKGIAIIHGYFSSLWWLKGSWPYQYFLNIRPPTYKTMVLRSGFSPYIRSWSNLRFFWNSVRGTLNYMYI